MHSCTRKRWILFPQWCHKSIHAIISARHGTHFFLLDFNIRHSSYAKCNLTKSHNATTWTHLAYQSESIILWAFFQITFEDHPSMKYKSQFADKAKVQVTVMSAFFTIFSMHTYVVKFSLSNLSSWLSFISISNSN